MGVVQRASLVMVFCCGFLLAEICPPDWHRYGESCYFIIMDKMDWYEANRTCAESRANLAVPNSRSEQDYIWELFQKEFDPTPSTSLWIGCNDIEEEGKWQHCPLKGETNAYENWAEGEPNSRRQANCGQMWFSVSGKWDDHVCSYNENYAICKQPVSKTPKFCLWTGKDGHFIFPEHSSPRQLGAIG